MPTVRSVPNMKLLSEKCFPDDISEQIVNLEREEDLILVDTPDSRICFSDSDESTLNLLHVEA